MRRARLQAVVASLLVAGGSGALSVALDEPAHGHTVSARGNFFWALGSREKGKDKVLDPINIQWIRGNRYTSASEANVKEAVERNWGASSPNGPPPNKHKMLFGSACLVQKDILRRFAGPLADSALQDAIFRGQGGLGNRRQETQYQGSTSSRCFTQYHMRFWTDHVHDENTPGHDNRDEWAISGVHHDISKCTIKVPPYPHPAQRQFGGCHAPTKNWVGNRNYAVRRAMRHLCGRSRWKQYPGGDKNWRGRRFDGYVARIELTYDGPDCDRGLK
jgi:hypothetical protein